ncbi:phage holin, lambda family [Pseudomonas urethralis]|uniref:phage holin, lambda family n=1 Tax=Pseudomonas urethralis TaxID=2740517 RepID=UPI0015969290|nr:phage holin, lambda family [Pseudomonas urethralis]
MDKDPGMWAAVLSWAVTHQTQLYAAGMSMLMAIFRVVRGGGTRRQMLLEGAMCGLITLALVPLLQWLGLPQSMATFAGGAVGFMGVDKIRAYSDTILSRKAQG